MAALAVLDYAEYRADSWVSAADGLIQKLREAQVLAGQILSIDAHNNGPDEAAIFSAFYSTELLGQGNLDVAYECHSSSGASWDELYARADAQAQGRDVISITGSCNSNGGAVLFVFYNARNAVEGQGVIQHLEVRADSWNKAATDMVSALTEARVKAGQVLCIDAHNNDPHGQAIFSAHYALNLPATGDFKLKFEAQNASYPWKTFYDTAAYHAEDHKLHKEDIAGITGSCNESRAVMYLFYWCRPGAEIIAFPSLPNPVVTDSGEFPLRVVSFNIWCDGGDSLRQTIAVIKVLNADVTCLQEAQPHTVRKVAKALGLFFSDTARVVSRFPVSSLPREGQWQRGGDVCAVSVPLEGAEPLCVIVGNVHLRAYPYAPYKFAPNYENKGAAAAVAVERETQLPGLQLELEEMAQLSRQNGSAPQILCGDFNCASHLDYIERVHWPCSLACEDAGFTDTYAQANPDHMGAWTGGQHNTPGITWTAKTAEENHNVFDRIDFIYASSAHLAQVVRSATVDGETPGCDPWPSDHRAVVSDLRLRVP